MNKASAEEERLNLGGNFFRGVSHCYSTLKFHFSVHSTSIIFIITPVLQITDRETGAEKGEVNHMTSRMKILSFSLGRRLTGLWG